MGGWRLSWWGRPRLVKLRRRPPKLLGIRPPVAAEPAPTGRARSTRLPGYVPRDHDAELRNRLARAARAGGFVLLVGGASTGKTRSAYEAARAVLPGWRLMLLDPARRLDQLTELPERTIVWLDGIEKHLTDGAGRLTRGDLASLIHRHRAVILGTVWPDHYGSLVERPGREEITGPRVPDVGGVARDLLALAGEPIHVPDRLSDAERQRAARAAAGDPRLRAALDDPDAGFTQALAGVGDLVRHWRQADRYARAVIDAAIDCRRLGVTGPLDEELLRAGASALLTVTPHTASVPGWFDRAIGYAARELRGRPGVLRLLPPPRRRRRGDPPPRRYRLADPIFEYGQRQRFGEPLPEHFLKTLAARVSDGPDLHRVARSLHVRGLHGLAEQLYRRGGAAGDADCRRGLALLLAEQGEVAEAVALLATAAADGDPYAHPLRLRILYHDGDAAALADLAPADVEATWRLAALLLAHGDRDGAIGHLERLWRAGGYSAALPLADLLAGAGRYDELAELATAGCVEASLYLLASEEAVTWQDTDIARATRAAERAQSRQPYGDPRLRREWLAIELAAGRADDAVAVLRELAAFGEPMARRQLCHLLYQLGRHGELRALAEAGDRVAGWLFADLLHREGRWRELRGLAVHGNPYARSAVGTSLAGQGQSAEAARWVGPRLLARLRLAHAHTDRIDRAGHARRVDRADHARLVDRADDARRGDQAGRAGRADQTENTDHADRAGHGGSGRAHLRALATSAVPGDRLLWAKLLAAGVEAGGRERAVRLLTELAAAGEVAAGRELVALAVAAGDEAALRRLACCGVVAARRALVDHLTAAGRAEEADRVRVHGLHPDGSTPQ